MGLNFTKDFSRVWISVKIFEGVNFLNNLLLLGTDDYCSLFRRRNFTINSESIGCVFFILQEMK